MVHVGCCGFPVSRPRYLKTFRVVEVNSTFYRLPMPATAERWHDETPKGFRFMVKAWQPITHPSSSPTYRKLGKERPDRLEACGHFRPTSEVRWAWERTRRVARTLKAGIVLFQTPATFMPDADKLRDMRAFFKNVRRGEFLLAWEPRSKAWTENLVSRVCADLDLIHVVDPLRSRPVHGRIQYFRMHGAYRGERIQYHHQYSDEELVRLERLCRGKPTYVFFNNSEMFEDAQRFRKLLKF